MGQRTRDICAGVVSRKIFSAFELRKVSRLKLVSRKDVVEAAERILGLVEVTPLVESRISGHSVWLKCESLQTGHAFKLRGATNRLLQLSQEQRSRGVVAFSSGNHAQGTAFAAKRLAIPAVIVMPSDAPAIKVEATQSHGAQIILYDRRTESREAIAQRLADDRGAVVVPSFDDPAIVAGQGTVGLEILEQMPVPLRRIVVPCGGGGLSSGIALACPDSEIVVVEPDGWDDMKRSLEKGEIVPVGSDAPATLCDALQTPRVSPITFAILRDRKAAAVSVSDEEVKDAIRFAWEQHGLVVEPGGAAGLAALLSGKVAPAEGMAVVISGGNIDPGLHSRIIAGG
jgi:threonine dehydratase